jgi:hypothetical protein
MKQQVTNSSYRRFSPATNHLKTHDLSHPAGWLF